MLKQTAVMLLLSINAFSQTYTHFALAKNLYVDVIGTYPDGYKPRYKYFVGSRELLTFEQRNFVGYNPPTMPVKMFISIIEYEGRAAVQFSANSYCDCVADIDIPGGSITLSASPKTFRLVNVHKTGRDTGPCSFYHKHYAKWDGDISLSANEIGDITVSLKLYSYMRNDAYGRGRMSYKHTANNVFLPNLFTPEMAWADVVHQPDHLLGHKMELCDMAFAKYVQCFVNETMPIVRQHGTETGLPADFHYNMAQWTQRDVTEFAKGYHTFDIYEILLGIANTAVDKGKDGKWTKDALDAQAALEAIKPASCKSWIGFGKMIEKAGAESQSIRDKYRADIEARDNGKKHDTR